MAHARDPMRLSSRALTIAVAIWVMGGPSVTEVAAGERLSDVPQWNQTGGPGAGHVNSVAIDPSQPKILYRGDALSGIHRTLSGGGRWRPASQGITDLNIQVLAVDPVNGSNVYAGTSYNGMFRSNNSGKNWVPANSGIPDSSWPAAIAVDTVSPSTVYVGVGDNANGGVYKSIDGAANWFPVNHGLPGNNVTALAIDPTDPATVYAGTTGVFKSIDGGANWVDASNGIPDIDQVHALAIDPSSPSTVYAGTSDGAQGLNGGVYKSTDGGLNWVPSRAGMPIDAGITALAMDPKDPSTLYASPVDADFSTVGIYKTTNGGALWEAVNQSFIVQTLAIDPLNETTIYAGTIGWGVIKSVDAGQRWKLANAGVANSIVKAMAADASAPATVYAGCPGASKTVDGGLLWVPKNRGIDPDLEHCPLALAIDPSAPSTVYAGTAGGGVFKSIDAGANWGPVNAGLTQKYVEALALDPSAPSTIYAGTISGGVFKSTNAGEVWAPVNHGLTNLDVLALAVDPSVSTTVYAGTGGGGVFKSNDGGAQWTPMNAGLSQRYVRALVIDPSAPGSVYVGAHQEDDEGFCTATSVFKSTNGGTSWTMSTGGRCVGSGFVALAIDPAATATVYAGNDFDGVYRTVDAGQSWAPFNEGLSNTEVTELAIAATVPSTVYVGTSGGGVFKYVNG